MSKTLVGIIIGGVVLLGVGLLFKLLGRTKEDVLTDIGEAYEVDTLELRDLLAWFKEHKEYLQDAGKTAVLLRVKEGEGGVSRKGRLVFAQGFYDKDSSELVASRTIIARKVSDDLEEKFGDKDMIVFE